MAKRRGFSLYDIEEYLKDAGAERVNEKAVISLERELQETVSELVEEAAVYANYAGRKSLINGSDIALVGKSTPTGRKYIALKKGPAYAKSRKPSAKVQLARRLNVMVATAAQDTS